MQAKLTRSQRFDALDHEAFGDMLRSRPFGLFLERIRQALTTASGDCEREAELKLWRAQGQAAALRMVLSLPETMLAEMRPKEKK